MNCVETLRAALQTCSGPGQIERLLGSLSVGEIALLHDDWPIWARADQLPPAGDWTTWLLLGGRGAGKTRAGAEAVRQWSQSYAIVNLDDLDEKFDAGAALVQLYTGYIYEGPGLIGQINRALLQRG